MRDKHRTQMFHKHGKATLSSAALACLLILGGAASVHAASSSGQGGGFTGPGTSDAALVTVEQARNMSDDARVRLRGNIVESLGHEHYIFKDATGTIRVEIDDKRWKGQNVAPTDTVELRGKVDKDWNEVEIDVKEVIKK